MIPLQTFAPLGEREPHDDSPRSFSSFLARDLLDRAVSPVDVTTTYDSSRRASGVQIRVPIVHQRPPIGTSTIHSLSSAGSYPASVQEGVNLLQENALASMSAMSDVRSNQSKTSSGYGEGDDIGIAR
jgi:hypothetical protein